LKKIVFLMFFLTPCLCLADQKADFVLVEKSAYRLQLLKDGEPFETFKVVFGSNPVGHKKKEGDMRTPEGVYTLDFKLEDSAFYKAIRISYPNEEDIARAREMGVDPGGRIMIHGQRNKYPDLDHIMQKYNWTSGCIAVTNSEMDIIWNAVEVGTPIEIRP
jgi:murein L,D-transpeptidase YafK